MDNYEQKYKEALERFRTFKEKYYTKETFLGDAILDKTGKMQKEFNDIFPELRESEDTYVEELRNFIHDFTRYAGGVVTMKKHVTRESVRSFLHKYGAWLEKQKEQKPNCDGCAKHLEGYIDGRTDAENKLLEKYGIVETPDDELKMKARWKPSEEQMGALQRAVNKLAKTDVADSVRLSIMYDNLKKEP